jgi:hypothetical protein
MSGGSICSDICLVGIQKNTGRRFVYRNRTQKCFTIRFLPFSVIKISPLSFKVISVGKSGGFPAKTNERGLHKKAATIIFFNICLGVFIVYIFSYM